MQKGTIIRGMIFCTASFAAAYWVSGWIFGGALPGVDRAAVFETSLLCATATLFASALSWFAVMSFAAESRLAGLGVGALTSQLIYPLLAILTALFMFVEGIISGPTMDANFYGDLAVGSIGFAVIAAIASGLFAMPIGAVLGLICAASPTRIPQTISPI